MPHDTPPRPLSLANQIGGFILGVTSGLALGGGAIFLLLWFNVSPSSTVARFILGTIGLLQFLWLIPLALLGWRRRNVGLILGVLLAALPILVLDAVCFGPMYLLDQRP
ncbi:MAG: hypothetical protein IPJ77_00475 [Planctomycetes bacterium]|nr:hypothetical protein [Planctomycetota bacterium]